MTKARPKNDEDAALAAFLRENAADLRRIAAATRGELDARDLHGAAWLMAYDIGQRLGRRIDFADPDDGELILRALNVEHIKRGDWKQRRAARLDQELDDEDGGYSLKDRLTAGETSDPLILLQRREDMIAARYAPGS